MALHIIYGHWTTYIRSIIVKKNILIHYSFYVRQD